MIDDRERELLDIMARRTGLSHREISEALQKQRERDAEADAATASIDAEAEWRAAGCPPGEILHPRDALQIVKDDAVRTLLDALAYPDGRDILKAWEAVTLLYGRCGYVIKRAAFEQYLDELARHNPGQGGRAR